MYIIDTNVISELRKQSAAKANPQVVEWAQSIPMSSMYVSAITILELEMGVLLKERKDPNQGSILRAWLDHHVMPAFSERVLPIDTAVAKRCAKLHVPDPLSERDALICATALVHGMSIVTRNTSDFLRGGVDLVNPWGS